MSRAAFQRGDYVLFGGKMARIFGESPIEGCVRIQSCDTPYVRLDVDSACLEKCVGGEWVASPAQGYKCETAELREMRAYVEQQKSDIAAFNEAQKEKVGAKVTPDTSNADVAVASDTDTNAIDVCAPAVPHPPQTVCDLGGAGATGSNAVDVCAPAVVREPSMCLPDHQRVVDAAEKARADLRRQRESMADAAYRKAIDEMIEHGAHSKTFAPMSRGVEYLLAKKFEEQGFQVEFTPKNRLKVRATIKI